MPDHLNPGDNAVVTITWENRGVAPAYAAYELVIRLLGPDIITVNIPAGNKRWLPSCGDNIYEEQYQLALPKTLEPGDYNLVLKLFSLQACRTVSLPLEPGVKNDQNFYKIGTVKVSDIDPK